MSHRIKYSQIGGFTLIELVVAIGIFAVLSVIVSISLRGIIDAKDSQDESAARFAQLQLTHAFLSRDFSQVINRVNESSSVASSFMGTKDRHASGMLVEFTRAGLINPQLIEPRSSLARVAYRVEGNTLMRLHWPTLDNSSSAV